MRRPFVLLFLLAAAASAQSPQHSLARQGGVRWITICRDERVNGQGVQAFCEASAASSESLF